MSGVLEQLASGGVKGFLDGVGSVALSIRTAITGEAPLSAEQRAGLLQQVNQLEAAAQAAAATYDTEQMRGQVELLKIDQQSTSLLKSGWRPASGWICVFGLAYTFMLRPLLPWCLQVIGLSCGSNVTVPALPDIPTEDLMVMLSLMLGLGGMRSFERVRGVAK